MNLESLLDRVGSKQIVEYLERSFIGYLESRDFESRYSYLKSDDADTFICLQKYFLSVEESTEESIQ